MLVLMLILQLIHTISGLPGYDLFYLALVTLILSIGEIWARVRFLSFTIVLFLVDISPSFILLPIILFILKKENINLVSKMNIRNKSKKTTMKNKFFLTRGN